MPEFERKKRKSLTEKQLYDEYYGIEKPKKKKNSSKSGSNSKSRKKKGGRSNTRSSKPVKRENPPISAERQRIKEQYPEANAVRTDRTSSGKKKKSSASKKGGTAAKSGTRNRKKRHGSYVLYYFLCGVVAVAVVAILSATVLFNVGRFEVIGDTEYSSEKIIAAAGIKEGENLLRIDSAAAEKRIISELVYIDKAKVGRGFPDKLIITVEPAVPLASYYINGRYYLVSEGGRVLDISSNKGEYPVVTGYVLDPVKEMEEGGKTEIGGQLREDGDKRTTAVKNIIDYMKNSGLSKNFSIDLTDILSIKVLYDDRVELQLGTTAAMDEKIFNASLLILDKTAVAENEKCVIIATNPNRLVKRPVREGEDIDNGYVVTSAPETEPPASDPEETTA